MILLCGQSWAACYSLWIMFASHSSWPHLTSEYYWTAVPTRQGIFPKWRVISLSVVCKPSSHKMYDNFLKYFYIHSIEVITSFPLELWFSASFQILYLLGSDNQLNDSVLHSSCLLAGYWFVPNPQYVHLYTCCRFIAVQCFVYKCTKCWRNIM